MRARSLSDTSRRVTSAGVATVAVLTALGLVAVAPAVAAAAAEPAASAPAITDGSAAVVPGAVATAGGERQDVAGAAPDVTEPAAPGVSEHGPAGPPPGIADFAATLPPLPRDGGSVVLPLALEGGEGPWSWRPVRDGVVLRSEGRSLATSYRVVGGQPAGAALVVRPGTLAGLGALRIRASANRNVQLLLTLQGAAGAVYSLPAVVLRVGTPREHERSLDDATYFPPQSSAPDEGGLDPSEIVMITLLDVSGFMSAQTPEVEWVVESIEGVVR